jgi:hypothetical protein
VRYVRDKILESIEFENGKLGPVYKVDDVKLNKYIDIKEDSLLK